MRQAVIERAWQYLDAVYDGDEKGASAIVRSLPPDDVHDVLFMLGHLIRGCVLGAEQRRGLDAGRGLPMLRSQFTHPSGDAACG